MRHETRRLFLMVNRLMQVVLPETVSKQEIISLLGEKNIISGWSSGYLNKMVTLHLLVPAEECEAILDTLEHNFSASTGFCSVLLPVEASLPRDEPEEALPQNKSEKKDSANNRPSRVSREELYAEINDGIRISTPFICMTVLSAIVAAIGLMRNDIAVIIGAMVIAPLLTPNVGLALSTTLGDIDLLKVSLKTCLTGFFIAVLFAVIIGKLFTIDPTIPAIASRTYIGMSDVILALAAGCAGSLAFTTGVSGALIGVMVAVALMPPLVVFGMMLGAGYVTLAIKAMLLVGTNVICVNLAGVATFLVQGVRPRTWRDANIAKKAARIAILIWGMLLMAVSGIIVINQMMSP